jgi:hypothetical protein
MTNIINEDSMKMSVIGYLDFKQIVDCSINVPTDEILLFENCATMYSAYRNRIPVFINCVIAIFSGTSKEFNDTFIKKTIFPKVKKIYINSEFSDPIFYNRFEKEIWVTTFFYYVPRNFSIYTESDFDSIIQYYKIKYNKIGLVESIKNKVYNTYILGKYYSGFL